MKNIVLSGRKIVMGIGSLSFLKELKYERTLIVTGGSSMIKTGVIKEAMAYLEHKGCEVKVHAGVAADPTIEEVMRGVAVMKEFKPQAVIAIGGGSAMDCAKAMLLFYEFPMLTFENVLEINARGEIPKERETKLICVPSTSGTGSEVTRGTVITDLEKQLKVPIMTDCLRPDIAILDGRLPMTMPKNIVAETGMDALTHAMEAYINHNLDEFDEALCSGAITGIMKWLPVSYRKENEEVLAAREKVHYYQAMAGIGFANVGLGMVHGIAHSFGAVFHMAHGLTNAIILPYALAYNRRNCEVENKLRELSYRCRCNDIVEEIKELTKQLNIPSSIAGAGVEEKDFLEKYDILIDHAMLGATRVNPVPIDMDTMEKLINAVYYGTDINF